MKKTNLSQVGNRQKQVTVDEILDLSSTGQSEDSDYEMWIGMRRIFGNVTSWYNVDGTPVGSYLLIIKIYFRQIISISVLDNQTTTIMAQKHVLRYTAIIY